MKRFEDYTLQERLNIIRMKGRIIDQSQTLVPLDQLPEQVRTPNMHGVVPILAQWFEVFIDDILCYVVKTFIGSKLQDILEKSPDDFINFQLMKAGHLPYSLN